MSKITFSVNTAKSEISISPSTLSGSAGDKVSFATNVTVYVKFNSGKWPFTENETVITVDATNGSGNYTLHGIGNKSIESDHYKVGTALDGRQNPIGIETSGDIDIS